MFEIVWPWLLLLIPLPWVVRFLLPATNTRQQAALKVPFFQVLQSLTGSVGNSQQSQKINLYLALIAWALLVFAASGPIWLGQATPLPTSGRSIMIAVDLSGSMSTKDMRLNGQPATRLQVVKKVAEKFIVARKGDRLGLILFGSRAYLQTPLTFDRKTVGQMLDDATVGLAGQRTAIGDAIGLAVKRLAKTSLKSRVLILLTDGVSNMGVSPLQAAEVAKKEHIRVYTIGLGGGEIMVNTPFGQQLVNTSGDLDETALQQIAKITGGVYFRAKSTQDLQKVYQSLNKLEPVQGKKITFRPTTPLYPWPLLLALLLGGFLLRQYKTC